MSSDPAGTAADAYPAILKGREGKMNGQIIRYLALSGPSLIYSVAQDLASRSETKVHYPTVNRRMHELVRRQYLEKAGTKLTKAGVPADMYATRLRGDFAALAGIPDSSGRYSMELSPKETLQLIRIASHREGSPFLLFNDIIEEGQNGLEFVDRDLLPEIINSVRNGYLNIDALDEAVICSALAALVARKVASLLDSTAKNKQSGASDRYREKVKLLMRSLDKLVTSPSKPVANGGKLQEQGGDPVQSATLKSELTPVSLQWVNELKVFLKLYSAMSD